MTEKNIYAELSARLPDEAIERTKKADTRKGYDTTGYGYQFVVDRLNEVCGLDGWGFSYEVLREVEGKYRNDQTFYDFTVNVTVSIGETSRTCVGGHISTSHADALKGAITNGLKKTAAFFGVGAEAYRGTIDEDYRPLPEGAGQGPSTAGPPKTRMLRPPSVKPPQAAAPSTNGRDQLLGDARKAYAALQKAGIKVDGVLTLDPKTIPYLPNDEILDVTQKMKNALSAPKGDAPIWPEEPFAKDKVADAVEAASDPDAARFKAELIERAKTAYKDYLSAGGHPEMTEEFDFMTAQQLVEIRIAWEKETNKLKKPAKPKK